MYRLMTVRVENIKMLYSLQVADTSSSLPAATSGTEGKSRSFIERAGVVLRWAAKLMATLASPFLAIEFENVFITLLNPQVRKWESNYNVFVVSLW